MNARNLAKVGHYYRVSLASRKEVYCVVGRYNAKQHIFCGYFFICGALIHPKQAVWIGRISDMGVRTGRWPHVQAVPEWKYEEWPCPAFTRKDRISGQVRRMLYDDQLELISETLTTAADGYPDFVAGDEAAEVYLDQLLGR